MKPLKYFRHNEPTQSRPATMEFLILEDQLNQDYRILLRILINLTPLILPETIKRALILQTLASITTSKS
jgi:hypothetical protein